MSIRTVFVALSYGRKWDGSKEEINKALEGWGAESQGTGECEVPATDSWRRFCALESKGKRNSVTKAFDMRGIQRTHSHCNKTQPQGWSYYRRLRTGREAELYPNLSPFSCPFPACLSTRKANVKLEDNGSE